jgi:hypothetical protein
MTWHQDIFRTRLRNRAASTTEAGACTPDLKEKELRGCNNINVILVGDKKATRRFIDLVKSKSPNTLIGPIVTDLSDLRGILERRLAEERDRAKKYIYQRLYEDKVVNLKYVANTYRNRQMRKVWSILATIERELPKLFPYLELDEQCINLRLRDAPGNPINLRELKARYAR